MEVNVTLSAEAGVCGCFVCMVGVRSQDPGLEAGTDAGLSFKGPLPRTPAGNRTF